MMVKIKHILVTLLLIFLSVPSYAKTEYSSQVNSNSRQLSLQDEFNHENYSVFMIYLLQLNLYLTGHYDGEISGVWDENTNKSFQNMVVKDYNSESPRELHFISFQLENMAVLEELGFFQFEDPKLKSFLYLPQELIDGFKTQPDGFEVRFLKENENDLLRPSLTFIQSIDKNHEYYHALIGKKWNRNILADFVKERTDDFLISEFETSDKTAVFVKTMYYKDRSETFILESNTVENIVFNYLKRSVGINAIKEPEYDERFMILVSQLQGDGVDNINRFEEEPSSSNGTGFVINQRGQVLTNNHVVSSCSRIEIDGSEFAIKSTNEDYDLALLEPTTKPTNKYVYGEISPKDTYLNQDILVAGFPLTGIVSGLVVTRGSVSSESGLLGHDEHFMITAPIQSGNSGSAVLNADGHIVGVVVAKMDDLTSLESLGEVTQNMNFAIDREIVTDFLEKNNIEYTTAKSKVRSPEAIIEMVKSITKRVDCF